MEETCCFVVVVVDLAMVDLVATERADMVGNDGARCCGGNVWVGGADGRSGAAKVHSLGRGPTTPLLGRVAEAHGQRPAQLGVVVVVVLLLLLFVAVVVRVLMLAAVIRVVIIAVVVVVCIVPQREPRALRRRHASQHDRPARTRVAAPLVSVVRGGRSQKKKKRHASAAARVMGVASALVVRRRCVAPARAQRGPDAQVPA